MKSDQSKQMAEFSDQGYVILRGFFEPQLIQGAREALTVLVDKIAAKLVAEGKIRDPLSNEPFETRLNKLFENHLDEAPMLLRPELHLAGLYPIFFNDRLLDVVETILGPEILLYPNYSSRPKQPGLKKAEVLWHQDGGYTEGKAGMKVDALRMVNLWAPLVTAHVELGCMQFVPGTHKLGGVKHAPHPQLGWLEIDKEFLDPRRSQAVNIEMDPGDVVLFHNMLFHQGLPNRSKIVRWNLDWRYLDGTQPTLRKEKGHLARSRLNAGGVVKDAGDWAGLSFT